MPKKNFIFKGLKDKRLPEQIQEILAQANCAICVDTLSLILDRPTRDITEALQVLRRYGQARVVAVSKTSFWIAAESTPKCQPAFAVRRSSKLADGWQRVGGVRA